MHHQSLDETKYSSKGPSGTQDGQSLSHLMLEIISHCSKPAFNSTIYICK
ncbi:UNVERIFIED_CONTAM: hypothetical protein FKN15_028323 [Acipenser sinensis]